MFKTLFGITKMVSKSRNHVSTANRNLLYFALLSNNRQEYSNNQNNNHLNPSKVDPEVSHSAKNTSTPWATVTMWGN